MVLLTLAALVLSGPLPEPWHPDCQRLCLGECYLDRQTNKCHDTMIVDLGTWDARPAPADWPDNAYRSSPLEFGSYPCEKRGNEPMASTPSSSYLYEHPY